MRFFTKARPLLIRNLEGETLLENFLISSVTTILVIRFFLFVTGYPQLGGAGFHIAHMLWGGFIMLLALFLLLGFLNPSLQKVASVLGGIGFGTFIDELGKFITSDNNYFFQPSIAIIYIIFIVLYLAIKVIDNDRFVSRREYLLNALEMVKHAVQNDLDHEEKKRALFYLRKCNQDDPFVKDLKDVINKAKLVDPPPPSLFSKIKHMFHQGYVILIRTRWFVKATLIVFGLDAISTVAVAVFYLYVLTSGSLVFESELTKLSFSNLAQLLSSTISAILVLAGAIVIRRSRINGYKLLKYSILVSIFFTQVFAFYQQQLQALTGLFADLFLFALVQYYISQEALMNGDREENEQNTTLPKKPVTPPTSE